MLAVGTGVVLGLIGLGVVALLVINASPLPVVISALVAAVTFPLLVALCFWLDRYEPEPGRYRVAALAWGGTAAVLIGAGLSHLLAYLVSDSEVVAAVVWAPVTEEFGKGLFLILLVVLRPGQLHGPLDGAIYAALVGIGFSFVEDTLYYSVSYLGGGTESLVVLVVLRGVLGAFSHSLYAAMFGIGLGIAVADPLVGGAGRGAADRLRGRRGVARAVERQRHVLQPARLPGGVRVRHAAGAGAVGGPGRVGPATRRCHDPHVARRVRRLRLRAPGRDRSGRQPAESQSGPAARPPGRRRRGRAGDEGLPADPDRDGVPARPGATRPCPPDAAARMGDLNVRAAALRPYVVPPPVGISARSAPEVPR